MKQAIGTQAGTIHTGKWEWGWGGRRPTTAVVSERGKKREGGRGARVNFIRAKDAVSGHRCLHCRWPSVECFVCVLKKEKSDPPKRVTNDEIGIGDGKGRKDKQGTISGIIYLMLKNTAGQGKYRI
jgi:hypothetical protein